MFSRNFIFPFNFTDLECTTKRNYAKNRCKTVTRMFLKHWHLQNGNETEEEDFDESTRARKISNQSSGCGELAEEARSRKISRPEMNAKKDSGYGSQGLIALDQVSTNCSMIYGHFCHFCHVCHFGYFGHFGQFGYFGYFSQISIFV